MKDQTGEVVMHERSQTFEELALRFRPDGAGSCVVQVVRSPYGCRDVNMNLKDLGASLQRFTEHSSRFIPQSRDLGKVKESQGTTSELTPEAVGGSLFRALFRDDLLWTFLLSLGRIEGREDLGLRIRLIFDPLDPAVRQLLSLPWELLYRLDTRDFLARSRFTPVVRYLEVPRLTTPLELTSQLRVLVAVANPEGTAGLDLERECRQMESVLRGESRIRLEILKHPTLPEIRAALQKFGAHVFHYMGHGGFDASSSGGGYLLFEDSQGQAQPVAGHVLAEALKGLPSLRFVFLNACRTAQISQNLGQDSFSGSASALVLAGVPAVIAMQFSISDRAALTFSQRLYEMLALGFPIDAAVAEARLAVHLETPSSYEWATPALFMSVPDGHIFAIAPELSPLDPSAGAAPPSVVSGHGTVGAIEGVTIGGSGNQLQGSVFISGQGHHIEGGIHVTLAELAGVDEATKRQLQLKYETQVRDFPEQAQYHFALGLSYLDQRLYDLSLASLKRALGKAARESDLLYYIALAQIAGKRPRILKLATVREIESYLEAAIRLDSSQFHYKLLLAVVKFDYYQCNGLRVPPPSVEQLLQDAQKNKPNPKEIRLLASHISLPEGPLLSLISKFYLFAKETRT